MRKRVRVKPSKGQSLAGFFMGFIFCGIGFFVIVPLMGPFGFIWTLVAVIITVIHGVNAFSDKGIASHEITIEDELNETFNRNQNHVEYRKTPEERMNELQSLLDKGMITQEEYQRKRSQILEEI